MKIRMTASAVLVIALAFLCGCSGPPRPAQQIRAEMLHLGWTPNAHRLRAAELEARIVCELAGRGMSPAQITAGITPKGTSIVKMAQFISVALRAYCPPAG